MFELSSLSLVVKGILMMSVSAQGGRGLIRNNFHVILRSLWLILRGDHVGRQGRGLNDWEKGLRWCDLYSRKNTLEAM